MRTRRTHSSSARGSLQSSAGRTFPLHRYLHDRHIVHRDIKPENLLLALKGDDVNVKLSDFGLAKVIKSEEGAGGLQTFCGTPSYIAPEVVARGPHRNRGDADSYGKPSDIWSMGVVLCVWPRLPAFACG